MFDNTHAVQPQYIGKHKAILVRAPEMAALSPPRR